MLTVLEKDDPSGIQLEAKRETDEQTEQQERFLRLRFNHKPANIYKFMTELPVYDVDKVRYHRWVNGCIESLRLVGMVI
jgi:hypothetical protein